LRKVILIASQFFAFLHSLGHQRRFKRTPRASASPPVPRRIAASHRSATKSADARRGAAHGGELHQAAGAAAPVAPNKRGVTRSRPLVREAFVRCFDDARRRRLRYRPRRRELLEEGQYAAALKLAA